jgi:hypothetical protein
VQKVRRKIEQRQLLLAQAELRETRTRRQTRRPDYVYNDDFGSEASPRSSYIAAVQFNVLLLEIRMMPTNILIKKKMSRMTNLTTTIFSILGQMYLTAQETVTCLLAGAHLAQPRN